MSGAGSIDWDAVRRQVELASAALEGQAGPDQLARLMRQRAAALAAPPAAAAPEDGGADAIEVLVFELAGESYGFEHAWVARVVPVPPLTALPGLPAWIVGIAAVEGEVLAVLDLRSLLSLPLAGLHDPAALVLLRGEGREFAVLAEGVKGVRRYPRAALQQRLPALDGPWLQGVAPDRTAVLDARGLLTDPSLVVQADRN